MLVHPVLLLFSANIALSPTILFFSTLLQSPLFPIHIPHLALAFLPLLSIIPPPHTLSRSLINSRLLQVSLNKPQGTGRASQHR